MDKKVDLEALKAKEKPYLKTGFFSQSPGTYAFFYIGNDYIDFKPM